MRAMKGLAGSWDCCPIKGQEAMGHAAPVAGLAWQSSSKFHVMQDELKGIEIMIMDVYEYVYQESRIETP